MKFSTWIKKKNESLALLGTRVFGSMWTMYIFCAWGLLGMLPWIPKDWRDIVLLVSSAWIQLWALPLLAVGNNVANRSVEKRAKEDHASIKAQLAEMHDLQKDNNQILQQLQSINQQQSQILTQLHQFKKGTK